MLKFQIVKREEGSRGDDLNQEMEFNDLEEFLNWANYHRNYIEEIKTLTTEEN